jgi:16S rRNA (cytosine967-C5)-methyltransferase
MNDPRKLAAETLIEVQLSKQTLDQLLASSETMIRALNRPDRALFHALVFGILRHQNLLDWTIDQYLRRSTKNIDPQIRIILRLGVYQIRFMDRVPDSAAVNTSVELAKKMKKKWAAGFVNGLLRSVVRADRPSGLPDPNHHPEAYLSTTYSFPPWLIKRWLKRWAFDHTEALCMAINQIPPVTIRANSLKTDLASLLEAAGTEASQVIPCTTSPEGFHLTGLKRSIDQWPAFQKGWFQVQGESAQLVSRFLAPQPGHQVWDACAGLGTKTAHMAQMMKNRGAILATDRHPGKLAKLDAEMTRLDIKIVESRQLDLSTAVKNLDSSPYDRILLDAPCSGLGVLQRNPDGKWNTALDDLHTHQKRQRALIEVVANHLKPNGILVYAVCSMEPEENEAVIRDFLQNHPEFDIFSPNPIVAENLPPLTPEGFLRTSPHPHKMDGFFAAALTLRAP